MASLIPLVDQLGSLFKICIVNVSIKQTRKNIIIKTKYLKFVLAFAVIYWPGALRSVPKPKGVSKYACFNFSVLSVKQANDIAFDWVLRDSKVVSNVIFTCLLSNTTGTSSECRGMAILITLSHKLKILQELFMLTKPV